MPSHVSLGNVFQIRKISADDQDLFNQCNNMRGLSESDYTQQFNQYQSCYDDALSVNSAQKRTNNVVFGGFVSEKSDNIDLIFCAFRYTKITEDNMSYYECNNSDLGKYVAREINYGIPTSLRGQQMGRILFPFINYWTCHTIPNLLNIVVVKRVYTIHENPNAPGIFKFNGETKKNGISPSDLISAGKLWIKTDPPPDMILDNVFHSTYIETVDDENFRFNWEEVSKNSDGKFYATSDPEFSLSNWLMYNIYDMIPPSSRSYDQVRDRIRQKFV